MIVTGANPDDDPQTRATTPMAVAVGGEPVEQYRPGHTNFSGHRVVIYLGHGEPGGELSDVKADQLIADLTDGQRGLSPGTEMILWSCYAATNSDQGNGSLVDKVHTALQTSGISKVRVSGVPGALYTNIITGSLHSGPAKTSKDREKRPEELKVITAMEIAVWMESGMCPRPTKPPAAKKVTIGNEEYEYIPWELTMPPRTTQTALIHMKNNGKIAVIPERADEQGKIVADAFREWHTKFFAQPIINAYMRVGTMAPWDTAAVRRETL